MKCEYCFNEHNGGYASGRFCNNKCSSGFSTKNNRIHINQKVSKTLKGRPSPFKGKCKTERISKKCLGCDIEFITTKQQNQRWCSKKCWNGYQQRNKTEREIYKQKCKFKFNVYDYPEYFNLNLINLYGWYSPSNKNNNLNGVSRDHIISITEGFKNNYNQEILSHPANCKLVRHKDNQQKNTKSNMTYENLLLEIDKFDKIFKVE